MDKVMQVDADDNNLGLVSLELAHQEGLLHRIAIVYLFNDQGQILVQERQDGRLDHSAAGHVDTKEDYYQAAKRELFEELGVDVKIKEIGNGKGSEWGRNDRYEFRVYKCLAEPSKLQTSEVKRVYWDDPLAIQKDMMSDSHDKKYCGCFKESLKIYLQDAGL